MMEAPHSNKGNRGSTVKYYFIDFGMSVKYEEGQEPVDFPIKGREKLVPEYAQPDTVCDSFALDIYILGSFLQRYFTKVLAGSMPVKPKLTSWCPETSSASIISSKSRILALS